MQTDASKSLHVATESVVRVKDFLEKESDYTGAEVDATDVSLDFGKLMAQLSVGGDVAADEDSDGEEAEYEAGGEGADEEGDAEGYFRAMDEQLQETTMADSFAHGIFSGSCVEVTCSAFLIYLAVDKESEEATTGSGANAQGPAGLNPVDIDLNLLSSLLDSYASQAGLSGPASNVLGMLGVDLTAKK